MIFGRLREVYSRSRFLIPALSDSKEAQINMINKHISDRSDGIQRLAIFGGRVALGLCLGIVLSMVGLVIAWGLFVFSSSSDRIVFMVMNMIGAGIGASIGVNIAWIRLDRQQRAAFILMVLVCVAGGVIGALLGYQYGANREVDCCAEPRTTPFIYAAFGATIGGNVFMYLATAATSAVRAIRMGRSTIPGRS